MFPRELTGRERRIRVARVITRLNVGGPAIQAMLLTRRLDPARFETLLICGRPGPREGDMLDLRPEPGVSPVVIAALGREIAPLADARTFIELVRLFRRFRPHVVHTHLAKAGVLGRLAARVAGVPVVVHTFHGNVLRGYFGCACGRAFTAIERALAGLSTRVIAISPGQAAQLRELGIARGEKLVEVPLGLDLEPFRQSKPGRLRAELGVGPDVPLVGIVARLVRIKRVDVFLDAAASLAQERPDALFVVAGDGDLADELRALAAGLGLADRVRFLGWRADLPAIYADLDVLVLTSDNEGTPISIIEALASGCAVVAAAVGGVPDVIDSPAVGVTVPHGDASAVAAAVGALLAEPERRRGLGARGRERVYPAYDARTLVAHIEQMYEELVGRRDALPRSSPIEDRPPTRP